jgi:muconate cycloisomerase
MKITSVETIAVSLPMRRPHLSAVQAAERVFIILRLHTDAGLVGLGEATVLKEWGGPHMTYYGESYKTVALVVSAYLAPALVGEDPSQFQVLHKKMDRAIKGYPYAKAALDIACYDAVGKALGVPASTLLGGLVRRRIPITHSIGIMPPEKAAAEAQEAVGERIATIKLKVGLDPRRDLETVRQVRKAVGPEIAITVDVNQGYPSPREAVRILQEMLEHNILFAEQPVEGIEAMAEVSRELSLPLMHDESAWTAQDVLRIIKLRAGDIISLYTTKPGGLWPAHQMAAVVEAGGLAANVNGSGETGVGNAANLHLAGSAGAVRHACVIPITSLEGKGPTKIAARVYLDDIIREPFKYEEGCLLVPEGPGLGISLDEEKLAKYRVAV